MATELPKPPSADEPIWNGLTAANLRAIKVIPAPKTGNWLKSHGSWENFCKEIHRSIGRDLGGGVVTFSEI